MLTPRLLLFWCVINPLAGALFAAPEIAEFAYWPEHTSPQEVGKRVAENFVTREFRFTTVERRRWVIYPEVCAWYGSLTLAKLTGDDALREKLLRKYDVLTTPEGEERISRAAHVDYRVFGLVPLEIYLQTKDETFLARGRHFADAQWLETTPDGITVEARYWVDDLYMSPALQAQAFRATGDRKYLDRAALMTAAYLAKLQQPNGLFYHAPDSPFVWGRGNGWVAAGVAELLRELPEDHPQRARILDGFKKMMGTLLTLQGEDGLWRQLIDKPESWPETSCTGMFAFAIVTGVKHGWLDAPAYAPAARKAWLGLVANLDENANVREVCMGTNKAAREVGPDLEAQYKFYMDRPRIVGDLHGQAPILWTGSALLR